jgi:hypothetical protein
VQRTEFGFGHEISFWRLASDRGCSTKADRSAAITGTGAAPKRPTSLAIVPSEC